MMPVQTSERLRSSEYTATFRCCWNKKRDMNYTIPNDPNMLYSYLNMMLRDRYSSLEEFCTVNDADIDEITGRLEAAGYKYDADLNQFR
jgi:hypothetical protein